MSSDKIYNITSKRFLTIGGQQYEKLKKQGYIIINNQLVPPNYEIPVDIKTVAKKSEIPSQLPTISDLYIPIFIELNINDLIALYSTNKWYKNQLNSQIVLNSLTQKYQLPLVSSFKQYIQKYTEYAIFLLNMLAPLYDIKYGFEVITEKSFTENIKTWAIENKIYLDNNDNVFIINDIIKKLNMLSQLVLPYQIIVIQRQPPIYSKAAAWFNKKNYSLPALKSKLYIKINIPFNKVTIDNNIKKGNLSINDVLFASRALSLENKIGNMIQYKYDQFSIYNNNNDLFFWENNINQPNKLGIIVKINTI
jgi:hypothetical protein